MDMNMSSTSSSPALSSCAACGKSGDDLKSCTACKLVKYCNVACQRAHRPAHKRECKRRAAELLDEALFKPMPPKEDCPLCFVPLPLDEAGKSYQPCCGKMICTGCTYAVSMATLEREGLAADGIGQASCPFCRTPVPSLVEEFIERARKRIAAGDTTAMLVLGWHYQRGDGVPQDMAKALEMWHRAAKLGCVDAHAQLGRFYCTEGGDVGKAKHHWEIAAMGGSATARYKLGVLDWNEGKRVRGMKHFFIGANYGDDRCLNNIRENFLSGGVSKEEFERALRAHKESSDEMQSEQRDAAKRECRSNGDIRITTS